MSLQSAINSFASTVLYNTYQRNYRVALFSFFTPCVGAATSPHHFVWKLQLLQPADAGPLSVFTGRPARALLATQNRPNQQQW